MPNPTKTVKLYDGAKHELLNEINKEEVIGDLQSWVDDTLRDLKEKVDMNLEAGLLHESQRLGIQIEKVLKPASWAEALDVYAAFPDARPPRVPPILSWTFIAKMMNPVTVRPFS